MVIIMIIMIQKGRWIDIFIATWPRYNQKGRIEKKKKQSRSEEEEQALLLLLLWKGWSSAVGGRGVACIYATRDLMDVKHTWIIT